MKFLIAILLLLALIGCGRTFDCDWCFEKCQGKGTQITDTETDYVLCDGCVSELVLSARCYIWRNGGTIAPTEHNPELWKIIFGAVKIHNRFRKI